MIGGQLEGAVGEIAATQGIVKQVTSLAVQDRQKINQIGGALENAVGEIA